MDTIKNLSIEELERRNDALRRELSEKTAYSEKLERELLEKCKDKAAMKAKIAQNKAKFGITD